jgi:hypothetical protein
MSRRCVAGAVDAIHRSLAAGRRSVWSCLAVVLLTSVYVDAQAFKEANGLVVMEGEHFATADPRADENGYEWRIGNTETGYVGTGYVDTPGPQGTNGTWQNACELAYPIDFATAGTYYVWVRRWTIGGAQNSVWGGLDDVVSTSNDNEGTGYSTWVWRTLGTINVAPAGPHTFQLRRREAEYKVDRIVLTTDSALTPTGEGPPESPRGTPARSATPSPQDQALEVARDTVLSWTAGDFAQKHNVYLGNSFADVNNASVTSPRNVLVSQGQTAATYEPGQVLEYGRTYYWRVDEVNAPPDSAVFKGEVWSFTVEPYAYPITNVTATASSFQAGMGPENTVNGSGLNAADEHSTEPKAMWLSTGAQPNWIQYEFDEVYKLHELLVWNSNQVVEPFIGFGAKDVTIEYSVDGAEWRAVPDVPEFAQANGLPTYTANTTVSFSGVEAKYVKLTINASWGVAPQTGLSEVRFSYVPVQARAPEPAAQATGVSVDTVLNWRPGRAAASHLVYFGTDPDAVAQGTVTGKTVTDHSYSPGALNYDTTYYWRVDEVNAVTYPGAVWDFTTQAYGVVDNFEDYTAEAGEEVFSTWIDGFDNPAQNGAIVGLATAVNGTFCDTTTFHGGRASMPFAYDNTAAPLSEAARTFQVSQDWTAHGVKSLSLWFQGAAGNGGQLYLKISNTKVPYNGGAADLARTAWLPWNLDLSTVGGLSKVTKLTIGVEGAGAKGALYIDDIRLYPKTPAFITPIDPGNANLQALWAFEGNANDTSGHGLNGTLRQAQVVSSGRPNGGSALQVEKVGYVDLGNPKALDFATGDWAVTAWFKTAMTGTGEANVGAIYGKGGDGTGGKRYCLILSNTTEGVVSLITDDDVTKYVADAQSLTNDDQWHFVVGQRQGTALEIYIDGQLEGTTAIAATYDLSGTSQHNAYIGAITNNVDASLYKLFNGLIDDVRVYNRALSPAEILWLMGQTTPVAKPF